MVLHFTHADVFASAPYRGNSLAVVQDGLGLDARQRLAVTQELRHFETVFLEPTETRSHWRARICDLIEELDFAGHPLLGAAAVLHRDSANASEREIWTFILNRKTVTVSTEHRGSGWWAEMAQGKPEFLGSIDQSRHAELVEALNLGLGDLHDLPLEIVSLGLPYVIVPLRRGLAQARIVHDDFAGLLESMGAKFAYVLDVEASEGRTWNNDGILEDVATGSAAGAVGAYLTKHGRLTPDVSWTLHQGRFAGRPSELIVRTSGAAQAISAVSVGGGVFIMGTGTLEVLP